MALTKCRECGNQVSTKAATCPHCGAQVSKPVDAISSTARLFVILFVVLPFGYCVYVATSETQNAPETQTEPKRTVETRPIWYAHKTVNVRSGPGTAHDVVGQIHRGDRWVQQDLQGGWAKGNLGSGESGWVSTKVLETKPIPLVEITSWNWVKDRNFGTNGSIIWTVEVRNNTGGPIQSVKLNLTTYDTADNVLTSDFTYVSGIPAGSTRSIKSYATYFGTEEKARVSVESYR